MKQYLVPKSYWYKIRRSSSVIISSVKAYEPAFREVDGSPISLLLCAAAFITCGAAVVEPAQAQIIHDERIDRSAINDSFEADAGQTTEIGVEGNMVERAVLHLGASWDSSRLLRELQLCLRGVVPLVSGDSHVASIGTAIIAAKLGAIRIEPKGPITDMGTSTDLTWEHAIFVGRIGLGDRHAGNVEDSNVGTRDGVVRLRKRDL